LTGRGINLSGESLEGKRNKGDLREKKPYNRKFRIPAAVGKVHKSAVGRGFPIATQKGQEKIPEGGWCVKGGRRNLLTSKKEEEVSEDWTICVDKFTIKKWAEERQATVADTQEKKMKKGLKKTEREKRFLLRFPKVLQGNTGEGKSEE